VFFFFFTFLQLIYYKTLTSKIAKHHNYIRIKISKLQNTYTQENPIYPPINTMMLTNN